MKRKLKWNVMETAQVCSDGERFDLYHQDDSKYELVYIPYEYGEYNAINLGVFESKDAAKKFAENYDPNPRKIRNT